MEGGGGGLRQQKLHFPDPKGGEGVGGVTLGNSRGEEGPHTDPPRWEKEGGGRSGRVVVIAIIPHLNSRRSWKSICQSLVLWRNVKGVRNQIIGDFLGFSAVCGGERGRGGPFVKLNVSKLSLLRCTQTDRQTGKQSWRGILQTGHRY